MPGGRSGLFPGVERLHQSAEYKQREAEDELLCSVGRDRLLELAKAEKDGRLVVLPCRETDTVYITEAVFENGKMKKLNKPSGEQVVSAQIDHVTIGGTGKPVFDLCTETGNWYYSMDPEQFYLTREAAEAALKEREVQTAENKFKCRAEDGGYCKKWLRECVGWENCGLEGYGAPPILRKFIAGGQ